jgi:hypothetical protein
LEGDSTVSVEKLLGGDDFKSGATAFVLL